MSSRGWIARRGVTGPTFLGAAQGVQHCGSPSSSRMQKSTPFVPTAIANASASSGVLKVGIESLAAVCSQHTTRLLSSIPQVSRRPMASSKKRESGAKASTALASFGSSIGRSSALRSHQHVACPTLRAARPFAGGASVCAPRSFVTRWACARDASCLFWTRVHVPLVYSEAVAPGASASPLATSRRTAPM